MKNKIIEKLDSEVILKYKSNVTLTGGKKNEQQGRVTKESELKVLLIGNPQIYLEAKQETNKDFVHGKRPWGIRVESGLIEHKEESYVDFIVKEYISSTYFLDDEPIEKSEIIGLKESTEQKDIDFRCVKISNILSVE